MKNKLFNEVALLRWFIQYFTNQAADLIKAGEKHKIKLLNHHDFLLNECSTVSSKNVQTQNFLDSTKINKLYLGEKTTT